MHNVGKIRMVGGGRTCIRLCSKTYTVYYDCMYSILLEFGLKLLCFLFFNPNFYVLTSKTLNSILICAFNFECCVCTLQFACIIILKNKINYHKIYYSSTNIS